MGMAMDQRSGLRASFRTGGSPLVGDQRRIFISASRIRMYIQRREFACTKQKCTSVGNSECFLAPFFSQVFAGAWRSRTDRVGSASMAEWLVFSTSPSLLCELPDASRHESRWVTFGAHAA